MRIKIQCTMALAALLGMASCSKPEAWSPSDDPDDPVVQLAEANCKCMDSYFRAAGVRVDDLLPLYHDFLAVTEGLADRANVEGSHPEVMLEVAKIKDAEEGLKEAACFRANTEKAKQLNPDNEKMLGALRRNCRLFPFVEMY